MQERKLDGGKDRRAQLAACFLFGGLGAGIMILFGLGLVWYFTHFQFLSTSNCSYVAHRSFCFFDDRWDSETYLSTLSTFYGTIIALLVGLLAVVAGFSFFAVRSSAFQRAEETIEREVEHYFETATASVRVQQIIADVAERETGNILNRLEQIEIVLADNDLLVTEGLDLDGDEESTE